MNIVNGFTFVNGSFYLSDLTSLDYHNFFTFFSNQIRQDPYSKVRDRGMLKIKYDNREKSISINSDQNYFQSYSANNVDGQRTRIFPEISEDLLNQNAFNHLFKLNLPHINKYCEISSKAELNISIHFIRYKANKGGASYSSPVWLHVDDEPLVFIHLLQLTENSIGADSVISDMDDEPKHVMRLTNPFDTLIVDTTKKHAVTPLGSTNGMAFRDIILMNIESDVQKTSRRS